jgi:signal transduction histidine kinase
VKPQTSDIKALQAQLGLLEAANLALQAALASRANADARLRQAERALKVLSGASRVIVHARDERALMEEICRIITELGGYRMAWVGLRTEDGTKCVEVAAQAGFEVGYLEGLGVTWEDNAQGQGPTGTAIRTGQTCVCQDLQRDPRFLPWRARAQSQGYQSSIALPLAAEGEIPFGALNLYAIEPDAFAGEELALLAELAANLCYGVLGLRERAERERAEAALLTRTVELRLAQELGREKNSFVGMVSHDLRTPLTSIMGFAEFLEDGLAGPVNEEQAGYLTRIVHNARRLARLVNDLLDFAQIEAGTFRLVRQEMDLRDAVQTVVQSLDIQIRERKINFEVRQPAEAVWVDIDAMRIEQVLLNLLGNALKFAPTAGNVLLELVVQECDVLVSVRDDGIGIAPAPIARLFERFYQVEGSAAREQGGSGLGLAIAKALVEAHQGQIGVNSEPGKGATFWFTLPLVAQGAEP